MAHISNRYESRQKDRHKLKKIADESNGATVYFDGERYKRDSFSHRKKKKKPIEQEEF